MIMKAQYLSEDCPRFCLAVLMLFFSLPIVGIGGCAQPLITQPARQGLDETLLPVYTKFTLSWLVSINDGDIAGWSDTYTVPEGKRLVIEYASFDPPATPTAPDPGAAYNVLLVILSAVRLSQTDHVLGVGIPVISSPGRADGITTRWEGGNMVRIYAGPGERIRAVVQRNFDGGYFPVSVTLTAYLEDDV